LVFLAGGARKKNGFRRVWRDMITGLLTTSSTQVLLNGVPSEFIPISEDYGEGTLSLPCYSF
jgi:hypothetical protein